MHDVWLAPGDGVMTEPTNRAALGHLLRLLMTTNPDHHDVGSESRRRVVEYIDAAEDTIEAQARLIESDSADRAARVLIRQQQCDTIHSQDREIGRLRTEVLTLRTLADAALIAGTRRNDADLNLVRQALEKTT
jgi:hypothetical protein